MTLGQKLRMLRKEKNWTQSELAGTEITRNMLSRIESGDALPSLPTLLYLSKRLHVSAGYFLSESSTLLTYKKEELLPNMKHWYSQGNYKEVVRLFRRDFTEVDDELAYLVARSAAECARESMHRGTMKTATEYLSLAKEMADATVYADAHLFAILELLSATLSNLQLPRFALTASSYRALAADATWEELYRYLAEDTAAYDFKDPYISAHVKAKELLLGGKYKEALVALQEIEAKKSRAGI